MKNLKFALMAFTVALIGISGFGAEHRIAASLAEDHPVVIVAAQTDLKSDFSALAVEPFLMAQVSFASLADSFKFAEPKILSLVDALNYSLYEYDEPERNYKNYSTVSINKEVKSRSLLSYKYKEYIQKYSSNRC